MKRDEIIYRTEFYGSSLIASDCKEQCDALLIFDRRRIVVSVVSSLEEKRKGKKQTSSQLVVEIEADVLQRGEYGERTEASE